MLTIDKKCLRIKQCTILKRASKLVTWRHRQPTPPLWFQVNISLKITEIFCLESYMYMYFEPFSCVYKATTWITKCTESCLEKIGKWCPRMMEIHLWGLEYKNFPGKHAPGASIALNANVYLLLSHTYWDFLPSSSNLQTKFSNNLKLNNTIKVISEKNFNRK